MEDRRERKKSDCARHRRSQDSNPRHNDHKQPLGYSAQKRQRERAILQYKHIQITRLLIPDYQITVLPKGTQLSEKHRAGHSQIDCDAAHHRRWQQDLLSIRSCPSPRYHRRTTTATPASPPPRSQSPTENPKPEEKPRKYNNKPGGRGGAVP